jgi:hypothetical protein
LVRWNRLSEKPVKKPGVSIKSKEAVPKTEVLEQPRVKHAGCNISSEQYEDDLESGEA